MVPRLLSDYIESVQGIERLGTITFMVCICAVLLIALLYFLRRLINVQGDRISRVTELIQSGDVLRELLHELKSEIKLNNDFSKNALECLTKHFENLINEQLYYK